jgi:hypothetical protein
MSSVSSTSEVVVPDSDSSQSDKVHSEIVRNRTSFRIVGEDGSIACKRRGADAFSQCEQRDAREEFVECIWQQNVFEYEPFGY